MAASTGGVLAQQRMGGSKADEIPKLEERVKIFVSWWERDEYDRRMSRESDLPKGMNRIEITSCWLGLCSGFMCYKKPEHAFNACLVLMR